MFSRLPTQYKNQYIYHEKSYKRTNPWETYLPVGTFRNELSFATNPWSPVTGDTRTQTGVSIVKAPMKFEFPAFLRPNLDRPGRFQR